MSVLLLAVLLGAPSWAGPDSKDGSGHTFVCEGRGKSEEDALAAAQARCSDKICRVCGVQVESTFVATETLKGVDLQRKVVERCNRVRTKDTSVRYKSSDCGPQGCTVWIQVFYSKEDEQAECRSYAQESFADPAACERDIDAFRNVQGRSSEAFRKRLKHLEDAIAHCEKIDVRPTPAIMALDEKLHAGMDMFEFTQSRAERLVDDRRESNDRMKNWLDDNKHEGGSRWVESREEILRRRPLYDHYLATHPPLRQQLKETKLLVERIRLVRDLVANKLDVVLVLEAAQAEDLDSPAGIKRLVERMARVGPVPKYGTPNVHFTGVSALRGSKSDVEQVGAFMRKTYPPDKLQGDESWQLALFQSDDERVSESEWSYVLAAHRKGQCVHCLRVMVAATDHGSPEVRTQRLLVALAEAVAGKQKPSRALKALVPLDQSAYLLDVEAKLPAEFTYDWDFLEEAFDRIDFPPLGADDARLVDRLMRELQRAPDGGETEQSCQSLERRMEKVKRLRPKPRELLPRICACLEGPLAEDRINDQPKNDLYDRAVRWDAECVR